MDAYFTRFGGVRDYLRSVVDEARQTGYTETIMGRRRYLANLTSDNRNLREMAERAALNAPIQGSAADIIKVAMLGVHRGLAEAGLRSRLLLQVHDELVLEIAPGEREAVEELVRARDGRRLPARRPARRLGRRRPHLARGRALSRRGSRGCRRDAPRGQRLAQHVDRGAGQDRAAQRRPLAPLLRVAGRPLRLDEVDQREARPRRSRGPGRPACGGARRRSACRRRRTRRRACGRSTAWSRSARPGPGRPGRPSASGAWSRTPSARPGAAPGRPRASPRPSRRRTAPRRTR